MFFVVTRRRNSSGIRSFYPFPRYSKVIIISYHPAYCAGEVCSPTWIFLSRSLVWIQGERSQCADWPALDLALSKKWKPWIYNRRTFKDKIRFKEKSILNSMLTCDMFRVSAKSKWKSVRRKKARQGASFPEGWGQINRDLPPSPHHPMACLSPFRHLYVTGPEERTLLQLCATARSSSEGKLPSRSEFRTNRRGFGFPRALCASGTRLIKKGFYFVPSVFLL